MNLCWSTPAEHLLLSFHWTCCWVCMRTYLQIWAQTSWHVKQHVSCLTSLHFSSRTQKPHCYSLEYKSDRLLLLHTRLWLKVQAPALKHTQQQQVLMLRHTWSRFEKTKKKRKEITFAFSAGLNRSRSQASTYLEHRSSLRFSLLIFHLCQRLRLCTPQICSSVCSPVSGTHSG